tara:strand:- start:55 stop:588 length:534 start_codon:yes stop_codon:yes gene_type:complete
MSQIINITSEALQATVRRLLPSQQGFGEDLQAVNVITPVIDLTPTAEGSQLPGYIQTAIAFGSQTTFDVAGATTTITSTPGFYRIIGSSTVVSSGSTGVESAIRLGDSLSNKKVWQLNVPLTTNATVISENVDFTVFIAAGENLSIVTDSGARLAGSIRQVATVDGELVNPSGFVIT